jgi:hypothetical protein
MLTRSGARTSAQRGELGLGTYAIGNFGKSG